MVVVYPICVTQWVIDRRASRNRKVDLICELVDELLGIGNFSTVNVKFTTNRGKINDATAHDFIIIVVCDLCYKFRVTIKHSYPAITAKEVPSDEDSIDVAGSWKTSPTARLR